MFCPMSKDEKKSDGESRKRGQLSTKGAGKGGVAAPKPKRGINKIPGYLRNELGLHDFLASSVVIVGGGLSMTAVVLFLSLVWPG
jgi:hypothetical protein